MSSSKNRIPAQLRKAARFGAAAVFALALAAGCGSSSDDSASPGKGGSAGTAGTTPNGGQAQGGGAGTSSAAGNAGTNTTPNGGSSTGGMMNGEAGAPEAGANGTALCGDGHVDPGEECDDGNTKDGDGCSSICTNRCEKCEASEGCATNTGAGTKAAFDLCYGTGQATAQGGPAAGVLKSTLCQDMMACLRKSACAAANFDLPLVSCYCGDVDAAVCATAPKGACVDTIARAAESRDFESIVQVLADKSNAAGAAALIVTSCDQSACAPECFQDRAPTKCELCVRGPDPFNFNLTCGDYDQCYFSGAIDASDSLRPGTSLPMGKLCSPAVECALRTGCATKGAFSCYGSTGTGPCAAEFAAAADSTDPGTVYARMTNNQGTGSLSYPATVATRLLGCEVDNCAADCFPTASGGTGGAGTGGTSAGTGGTSAGTGGTSAGTGGTSAGTGGGGTGGI